MNVAFDPWIPVVTTDGTRELASLYAVLTNGERFADLAVRPHERVSLMRLLLCVAHAALDGPKDYDEWCEAPIRLPDAARDYLKQWRDWFELFHSTRPWLQVAGLAKDQHGKNASADIQEWTPVTKLNFSFATGNNTTLFDHGGLDGNRKIPIGETLLSMLTFQCFSPGGLISQVYWEGTQTGKSSKDSPCAPSSMMHAFVRGATLVETVHRNLLTYDDMQISYGGYSVGKPVWEMVPISKKPAAMHNATTTYLGRLVPMARVVRLHSSGERMLLGDGLVYPTFADGFWPEPSATVIVKQTDKKEERALLSFRPSKAIWRELAGIVVKRGTDRGGPLSLRTLQDDEACDLVVAALARNQATIVDTTESVFHIPARLRSPEGAAVYEAEVKTAETQASQLGWAVETYRREIDGGWEGRLKSAGAGKGELKAKLHSVATTHYWTSVEKNLPLLMRHIAALGSDDAITSRDVWRGMLSDTARDAYRLACGQESPRQIRAFALGWKRLMMKQHDPLRETNQHKEDNQ